MVLRNRLTENTVRNGILEYKIIIDKYTHGTKERILSKDQVKHKGDRVSCLVYSPEWYVIHLFICLLDKTLNHILYKFHSGEDGRNGTEEEGSSKKKEGRGTRIKKTE